ATSYQAAVNEKGVGPFDINQGFWWRMNCQRIGKRIHARINRSARRCQRLVRLQHHGKLDKIETTDPNKRSRTFPGRDVLRVLKGPASLSQRDQPKSRRQIQ